jgi:hypothetical protein
MMHLQGDYALFAIYNVVAIGTAAGHCNTSLWVTARVRNDLRFGDKRRVGSTDETLGGQVRQPACGHVHLTIVHGAGRVFVVKAADCRAVDV